jgi:oligopeptide/dipeptide ABC transporter ATP-binding protein
MLGVLRLIRTPNAEVSGKVVFRGRDLLALRDREMRAVRGREIAMIFQDPMTALTPVYTVGWQIVEQLRAHRKMSRKEARQRSVELLAEVGIPNPERRVDQYPHEFSGGMRQRVMIAMALSCNPKLLIADEPTTALDVTIQAQILELIKSLRQEFHMAVLLITHDLGVIAGMCDRVVVMYGGRVLETGTNDEIFLAPRQPYTQGLLQSIPRLDQPRGAELTPIPGNPPDMLHLLPGCPFTPRCPLAIAVCPREMPPLLELETLTHRAACWVTVGDTDRAPRPNATGAARG